MTANRKKLTEPDLAWTMLARVLAALTATWLAEAFAHYVLDPDPLSLVIWIPVWLMVCAKLARFNLDMLARIDALLWRALFIVGGVMLGVELFGHPSTLNWVGVAVVSIGTLLLRLAERPAPNDHTLEDLGLPPMTAAPEDFLGRFAEPLWTRMGLRQVEARRFATGVQRGYRWYVIELTHDAVTRFIDGGNTLTYRTTAFVVQLPEVSARWRLPREHMTAARQVSVDDEFVYAAGPVTPS